MKHILLLNYEFPPLGGGASPVSKTLAEYLISYHNCTVDVVTMGYKGLPSYEEVSPFFRVHRVSCFRSKKEISYPYEQLSFLFFAFFQCRKLLQIKKYDICHCHFIIPTGVIALILKKIYKLNYIITAHGSDVLGYNPRFNKLYPFLKKPWNAILQSAKAIISPSQFLATKIKEQNSILVPIWIPNGIDNKKFIPSIHKKPYILLVSRLFETKGIQVFLEAFAKVSTNWNTIIIGDGPYRQSLEELTRYYKLNDRVAFLGWKDNTSPEMQRYYAEASIFVLPSFFENWNTTLLEAMVSECSVIASRVGGNPEIVSDAGLLFTNKDANELAESLQYLIDNESERKIYQKKGKKRVDQYFSWYTVSEQYYKIL